MTRPVTQGGMFVVVGVLLAIGFWLHSLLRSSEQRSTAAPALDVPELFDRRGECPHGAFASRAATRAESQGIFLSERYPYDARDGVRAVQRFQEARSCYEASGEAEGAHRAARRASMLAERIQVDYASSRLALESAMAAEKWSAAQDELRKLLQLTAHVGGHPFAEHLRSIAGKLASRATVAR